MHLANITISGIPVTVSFDLHPAEPDVGIFRPYTDELTIVEIAGRTVKKRSHANWLYDKLSTREIWEKAVCEALENREDDNAF